MTQPNTDELSNLVDDASRLISKKEAAQAHARHNRKAFNWLPHAASLAMGTATVFSVWTLWSELAPPGASEIQRDLESTIELARQSVETARKDQGNLPSSLPNPALASMVSYQPEPNGYSLSITSMGIRITIGPDGQKQVEMGEAQ